MNHLDTFVDSLTTEDFIKAYPGSLEFIVDDTQGRGLEACQYLQRNCAGIYLYINNITTFNKQLVDYMRDKKHIVKQVAMDMHISEGTLNRFIREDRNENQSKIFTDY